MLGTFENSPGSTWSAELQRSYTDVDALSAAGLLRLEEASRLRALGDRFKVRVTPYYAGLIDGEDARDPIRLQAIPALGEDDPELGPAARAMSLEIYGREAPWHADAIGDLAKLAAPRLTHRYGNRAILHLSSMCAVYCRFCFRKSHLNDSERTLYEGSLDPAFAYLAAHPEVSELVLTGGDPLSITDAALARLLERASTISSLRMLRIHSRMPVTLPSRITAELSALLGERRFFRVALTSHFNHPRELTAESRFALDRLARAGVTLLNQSVLLAGVNDTTETLGSLFQGLYEAGSLPFYLHHPDWTPGTFQFRRSISFGQTLMRELRGRVAGPALPRYVLDLPQGLGKVSLEDSSFRRVTDLPEDRGIAGAVYEVPRPDTREGARGVTARYLDLFTSSC